MPRADIPAVKICLPHSLLLIMLIISVVKIKKNVTLLIIMLVISLSFYETLTKPIEGRALLTKIIPKYIGEDYKHTD